MKLRTYLTFEGNAEEALKFYEDALSGEISTLMRYSEMPSDEGAPSMPEGFENNVLHAALSIGDQLLYMSDAFPGMAVRKGNNCAINIEPTSEEELHRIYDKLVLGGTVEMPIDKMFWGSLFASLVDKFGVHWNLDFELKQV